MSAIAEEEQRPAVPPASWETSPAFASLAALLLEGDRNPAALDRLHAAPVLLPALRFYMGRPSDSRKAIDALRRASRSGSGYGGWGCDDGMLGFPSFARAQTARPFPKSPLAMAYVAGANTKSAEERERQRGNEASDRGVLNDIYLQCCSDIGAVEPFFCGCLAFAHVTSAALSCAPIRRAKLEQAFKRAIEISTAGSEHRPLFGRPFVEAVMAAASVHKDPVSGAAPPRKTKLAIDALIADDAVWGGNPRPDAAGIFDLLKREYMKPNPSTSVLWCTRQDLTLARYLVECKNDALRDSAVLLTVSALASARFDAGLSLVVPMDPDSAADTFGMRFLVADEPMAATGCATVRIWGGDSVSVRHYNAVPALLAGAGSPARWSAGSVSPMNAVCQAVSAIAAAAVSSGSPGPLATELMAEIDRGRDEDIVQIGRNDAGSEVYFGARMAGMSDIIVAYARLRGCATSRDGFAGLAADAGTTAFLIPRCAARRAADV